ncbi:MAG: carboxy-S-adenosyl-L-methionine synthase CmoA [Desulfarculaceae bacterium]|nr:carboxy-S-adenosyl-L-methionine synthase CmoA [Desulfarculaceae bacterium]
MPKDRIFAEKTDPVQPFRFDERVATVFDDMLHRSVPLYAESIRLQAKLAVQYFQPGTRIYDLGCSNGNLGVMICNRFGARPFSMKAVDSSAPMIEKYRDRLSDREKESVRFVCDRIEDTPVSNASVVILNLTIQFVAPEKRDAVVKEIFNGLLPGGVLLLTEKITHRSGGIRRLYESFYTDFKLENGYSELEISQKRDALEEVLIPETLDDHQARLERAGFGSVDVWLKWFNFASLLAVKQVG